MSTRAENVLLYQSEPVSAWLSLLEHPEEEQRRRAAEKLLEISAAIASVLPALSGVLRNPDSDPVSALPDEKPRMAKISGRPSKP